MRTERRGHLLLAKGTLAWIITLQCGVRVPGAADGVRIVRVTRWIHWIPSIITEIDAYISSFSVREVLVWIWVSRQTVVCLSFHFQKGTYMSTSKRKNNYCTRWRWLLVTHRVNANHLMPSMMFCLNLTKCNWPVLGLTICIEFLNNSKFMDYVYILKLNTMLPPIISCIWAPLTIVHKVLKNHGPLIKTFLQVLLSVFDYYARGAEKFWWKTSTRVVHLKSDPILHIEGSK